MSIPALGKERKRLRTFWFFVGTIAYAIVSLFLTGWYWGKIFPLMASDAGSLLAGIFSPLAFLWLLYASLSQRDELELQRNELQQNNRTQADQAQAMQAQVDYMSAQAEARYAPIIFALDARYIDIGRAAVLELTLTNSGAPLLNVAFGPRTTATFDRAVGAGGSLPFDSQFVAHWPTGGHVVLRIDPHENEARLIPPSDMHVELLGTRLDTQRFLFRYLFRKGVNRLELVQRTASAI